MKIEELTGVTPSYYVECKAVARKKPKERQPFELPEKSDTSERVISYLTWRGIDRSIVLDLINEGRI